MHIKKLSWRWASLFFRKINAQGHGLWPLMTAVQTDRSLLACLLKLIANARGHASSTCLKREQWSLKFMHRTVINQADESCKFNKDFQSRTRSIEAQISDVVRSGMTKSADWVAWERCVGIRAFLCKVDVNDCLWTGFSCLNVACSFECPGHVRSCTAQSSSR